MPSTDECRLWFRLGRCSPYTFLRTVAAVQAQSTPRATPPKPSPSCGPHSHSASRPALACASCALKLHCSRLLLPGSQGLVASALLLGAVEVVADAFHPLGEVGPHPEDGRRQQRPLQRRGGAPELRGPDSPAKKSRTVELEEIAHDAQASAGRDAEWEWGATARETAWAALPSSDCAWPLPRVRKKV